MKMHYAKNSVTGKWWNGKGFSEAPMAQCNAKALTAQELIVLRHTYENVESIAFNVTTSEEMAESEAVFMGWFAKHGPVDTESGDG